MKPRCPTCRKALADSAEARPFRPFCSSRCRLADLGKWLDGGFKIESPASEEDLDQGLPTDESPEKDQ
ncbi:MAG TPA: DNA gyrase inhibitor YacG [Polyangia bacterium]|nr:DNA gyrase inhibitor YacG [Polyangia bacterium]